MGDFLSLKFSSFKLLALPKRFKMSIKFLRIIQTNFLLWWRSKISVFALLFGPLFLIVLLGSAFSNSDPYSVSAGVYSGEYGSLTKGIIDEIETGFQTVYFDSDLQCVEDLKQGKIHICIVFPANLSVDDANSSNEIKFYVDYSKVNLAWAVVDAFSSKISAQSSKISMNLTANILNKLDQTNLALQKDGILVRDIIDMSRKISDDLADIQDRLSYFESSLNSVYENVSDSYENTEDVESKLASIKQDIESAKEDVNDLNLTGSEIADSLNNAVDSLNNADSGSLSKLISLLDSVKSDIDGSIDELNSINQNFNNLLLLSNQNLNNIHVLGSSLNKTIVNLNSIKINDAEHIVHPITAVINPISAKRNYLSYTLPTLMVLLVMFTSVLLSSSLIGVEKKSKAFFRNFISPTRHLTFVLARFITDISLVMLQLGVFILIAMYFLKSSLVMELGNILAILFLAGSMFVFLGMAIGYFSASQEGATLISVFVASLFMFFSGAIIPIESMPASAQALVRFNPFVISENLLRKSLVHHMNLASLGSGMVVLLGYAAAFFVLTLFATKYMRQIH